MTDTERIEQLESAVSQLCENEAKHVANFKILHEAITGTTARILEEHSRRLEELTALLVQQGEVIKKICGAKSATVN
jgi:hypothetical protein